MIRIVVLVALLALSASRAWSQTTEQIINDLDALTVQQQALLSQLRALVIVPPLPEPPTITTAAELTAALVKGGIIPIAPGTYKGNWTVSVTSQLAGATTLTGRVAPADVAGWTLTAADPLLPVLTVPSAAASGSSIRGLTLTGVAADRTTVVVGSNTATDPVTQPQNISVDQTAILALGYGTAAASGGHRGLEAHGANIRITNNYIAGYVEQGRDSQAIWINNGTGPYLIENNYLEGSGENILVGGDTIKTLNLVPSDLTIRGNTLFKPQAWRTKTGSVKNTFELKNAQRVLFENNILDGCWTDGQSGNMIVLTPRNQNGDTPWVVVQDVIIRGNRSINHTGGYAINILGRDNLKPSKQTNNITIEGNLFQDSPNGIMVGSSVTSSLRVVRNTMPKVRWKLMTFEGTGPLTPLTFDLNVALSGEYGINSNTAAPGVPTLAAYTTVLVWTGNVIERTAARAIQWPSATTTPPGTTTVLAVGALAPLLDANFHYPGAGW